MTVDIISEFAFGTCINLIHEHPDSFKSEYLQAMGLASDLPFLRYFSTVQWLLAKFIPLSVAANFNPVLRQTEKMIGIIVDSYHNYSRQTTQSRFPVIFDTLTSLSADLQKAEAINIFIAGSDTTAFTITTALYHILQLPEVEETLTESLDEVFGMSEAVPSLVQLEQVKYLVCAIGFLYAAKGFYCLHISSVLVSTKLSVSQWRCLACSLVLYPDERIRSL